MLEGIDPQTKKLVPLGATVDQVSRDLVRVRTAPGYTTAVFQSRWKHLEIMITSPDGNDTWRVQLADANGDDTITIKHGEDGDLEVHYERAK